MSIRFIDCKLPPVDLSTAASLDDAKEKTMIMAGTLTPEEYQRAYDVLCRIVSDSDCVYVVTQLPDGTFEHKFTLKDGAK